MDGSLAVPSDVPGVDRIAPRTILFCAISFSLHGGVIVDAHAVTRMKLRHFRLGTHCAAADGKR
jgi:hypothetical protein